MRLRTNRQQLEGIELLLGLMLQSNFPAKLIGRLTWNITHQIWQKIRKKTEAIKAKDYGITLTDNEALELVMFYEAVPPIIGYDYETLQMDRIINELQSNIINKW